MSSFDEFTVAQNDIEMTGCKFIQNIEYDNGFKAGAQSRQAEVDELKKRIDDALKEFEENNDPWSMIVDEVIKILKGENHES